MRMSENQRERVRTDKNEQEVLVDLSSIRTSSDSIDHSIVQFDRKHQGPSCHGYNYKVISSLSQGESVYTYTEIK